MNNNIVVIPYYIQGHRPYICFIYTDLTLNGKELDKHLRPLIRVMLIKEDKEFLTFKKFR